MAKVKISHKKKRAGYEVLYSFSQKKQNITADDISSFMNQWVEQPPTVPETERNPVASGSNNPVKAPKVIDHAEKIQGEPVYSSALAKLRAKKAARAKQQQQTNANFSYNQNQTSFDSFNHAPARPTVASYPPENEKHFLEKSIVSWNRILAKNWSRSMETMFNELWVSTFKYT